MILAGLHSKPTVTGVAGLGALLGFTAADVPVLFAIAMGVFAGTFSAWPRDKRLRKVRQGGGWEWLLHRVMIWLAVLVIALWVQHAGDLHARSVGVVAWLLTFGGVEGLNFWHAKGVERIASVIDRADFAIGSHDASLSETPRDMVEQLQRLDSYPYTNTSRKDAGHAPD